MGGRLQTGAVVICPSPPCRSGRRRQTRQMQRSWHKRLRGSSRCKGGATFMELSAALLLPQDLIEVE
jgi:hypothetical protein